MSVKKCFCAACGGLLLLSLAACTPQEAAPPPAASPTLPVTATAEPSLLPTLAPLSEEDVRSRIEAEGEYQVVGITPWEGDYLVEASDGAGGWRILYWVFGDTGMRVWLNREITDQEIDSYKITGRGTVEIMTTGKNLNVPYQGLPRSYTAAVTVDSQGRILPEGNPVSFWENQSHDGWLLLEDPGCVYGGPFFPERYAQIYEIGLGVDGLSISFIPSGDPERYHTFFPAHTDVPTSDYAFDPVSRTFTLRLYNTALESGGIPEEHVTDDYRGLYPHVIPAGALGGDSHFIQSASIAQDGEDAVISLTLDDAAYAYVVASGNLGNDNFPYLRLSFRENVPHMDD